MASVTQLVPTLTGGVSQQPDELKVPGQVNVANNVLPDVTHGLLKRPGGKLIKSLSDGSKNSVTDGRWFHYYRDEDEQYIGQIARNGMIKMWKCSDGSEMNVVGNGNSYLIHNNDEDIQTLTINDYTFLTNRTKTVTMSTATEPLRPPEVFIELKTLKYAAQYAVNLFSNTVPQTVSTATRISVEMVRSSNNYCDSNGNMQNHVQRVSNTTRCSTGTGSDDLAPNVGTRIFEVASGGTLVDHDAVSTLGGSDFSYQVNINNNGSGGRSNLYFRITTTGQSTPVGSGSNVEYRTRYTTTNDLLYGGEGWQQGDFFYVYMKDGYYKVTIDEVSESQVQANLGLIRPNPTSFDTKTTVTPESILGTLRAEIAATGHFNTVEQIGNGLYISRTSNIQNGVEQNFFNVSTPVSELLNVVAGEVLTVDDLPRQCKDGFVVKIKNSANEEDDYYLKFIANNGLSGEGVWEECVLPGANTDFDASTMPLQLVRTNSTTFTLTTVAWEGAQVGDTAPDGTNPRASFVGKTINKMVFFRNRLVMLSDENVIMSRPGNFFNFWAKTATTFSNVDPIDLSCSSTYPAIVFDAIQVNTGLVIFTKNQQFMLTTDSDVLNPNTAKINRLSSYNFNHKTNPVNLGTTIGFLDNANKYSRFFEMSQIRREGEPDVVEQSKVVSQLFENDLKIISNSRENGLILFSEEDTPTMYGYRYFTSGNERILQAWFSWRLTGTIRYHCMLDDALYVVVRNNNKDQLLKYSVKLDDNGHFVTAGEDYPIHLDHCTSVTAGASTYDSTTNKTTIPKPTGFESTDILAAYDTDSGNNLGRFADAVIDGNDIKITGNWSSETFLIGYQFEMEVQLPKIFFTYPVGSATRRDTRSNLIVHRVKFNFGKIGMYDVDVLRTGKPTFTQQIEATPADAYIANYVALLPDIQGVVPCYERNNHLVLIVKSKHPSPATIVSYQWEGKYTNKNYQRV